MLTAIPSGQQKSAQLSIAGLPPGDDQLVHGATPSGGLSVAFSI